MKNTTTKFMVLAIIALLAMSQANASEQEVTSISCERTASVITKISNCLHRVPVISSILNRKIKFDYVAEDSMLENYMLSSTSDSLVEDMTIGTDEELAFVEFTEEEMSMYEESDSELIAYEGYAPISFAADFENENVGVMEDVKLDVAP